MGIILNNVYKHKCEDINQRDRISGMKSGEDLASEITGGVVGILHRRQRYTTISQLLAHVACWPCDFESF